MEPKLEKTTLGFRIPDFGEEPASRVPVLIVMRGTQLGRRYILNEASLILGRKPERADIVIEGDPQISSTHSCVFRSPGSDEYFVSDLESLNGTYVNGQSVKESRLQDGDKLLLGQTILKFTFQDPIEESFHGRLDKLINTDDLTGLLVLRAFNWQFHERLRGVEMRHGQLGVMMMDMDGLKKINDTHGHHFGAYTISEVGKLIGETVKDKGQAARFGGDEFVAYAENLDKEQTAELAEKIRKAILTRGLSLEGVALEPTISIGVASFPQDGSTVEVLIRKADEALYRAKNLGRNRVST